jgi:hypothetical protein
MATVQELERAFLNAHNAGDKQAAQALADALRSAMSAQPAEAPAAPKERTYLEAGKDILAGGVSGAGALAQLPGQLYGLATGDFSDTGLTKIGRQVREYAEEMKSPGLKQAEAERAAKIKEAGKEGEFQAGVTAFMETVKNPGLLTNFIAEQAPNLLPGLAVARGLARAGMATGAMRGAIGTGAVQQGADVGAETFKRMHEELVSKGVSPEEATGQVLGYARWVGLGAGALSAVVNSLPGGRAIEEAMAKVPIKGGRLSSMVKGGAGEAAAEMVEEGGGKVLQNLAIRNVKPDQSLTEGLGETMGMAAVGGMGLGTAAGLSRRPLVETLPREEVAAVERPAPPAPEAPAEPPEIITKPPKLSEAPKPPEDAVAAMQNYFEGKPEDFGMSFSDIQNRDRTKPASIQQMNSIANNPDYNRLSVSRDFGSGAPVVISDFKLNEQTLGRVDTVSASDGTKIPVQYAVIEAETITPSNRADGSTIQSYADPEFSGIRPVAGNGRIAGLQKAYKEGKAQDYLQNFIDDTAHGINSDVIKQIENPVLIRIMPKSALTSDIADKSNVGGQLGMSPTEQAKIDMGRFDLQGINFLADGTPSINSLRQFVATMPKEEQAELINRAGQPNPLAKIRLSNALFARAYENDALIDLFAETTDPEAQQILKGMAIAAPAMSNLSEAGDYDIRRYVTKAAEMAVNARRQNKDLAEFIEQGDIELDPLTREIVSMFATNKNAPRRVGDSLTTLAAEANKAAEQATAEPDMFGNVAVSTPLEDVFAVLRSEPTTKAPIVEEKKLEEIKGTSAEKAKLVINKDPEHARIEKELTGRTLLQAAQWAVDNAPNEFAKAIAQKVSNRLNGMAKRGIKLDFEVVGGETRPAKMRSARGLTEYDFGKRGEQKMASIKITLNGDAVVDNQAGYPPGTRYITVLHELLHAATVGQINVLKGDDPIVKELRDLFNKVVTHFNTEVRAGRLTPFMEKVYAGEINPLTGPDELVAWGIADRDMQEFLSEIKVGEQTLMDKLVELIRKVLNITKPYLTALDQLVKTTESILDEDVNTVGDRIISKQYSFGVKPDEAPVQGALFEQAGKPSKVEAVKKKAKKVLQKRKLPKSQFEGVSDDLYADLEPVFAPERKTIIDKIDGMRDDFWMKLAQGIADQYRSIKDISPEAYMKARMSKTIDGALEGILFNGEVKLTDGALDIAKDTKGLLKVLEPVGAEVDRYQIWVALQRDAAIVEKSNRARSEISAAEDEIKRMGGLKTKAGKAFDKEAKKILDDDSLSSSKKQDALKSLRKSLDNYRGDIDKAITSKRVEIGKLKNSIKSSSINPKIVARRDQLSSGKIGDKSRLQVYESVQKDMNKLNRSVLKVALQQGIIDQQAFETLARDINYIPFYKMLDENSDVQAAATNTGLVNQYFSKALKGGEKPFGDLMENTLRNWSHILSASMKNEAANATVRATMDMGGAFPNLKRAYEWQLDDDGRNGKVYSAKTGEMVGDGSLKPEYTSSEGKGLVKTMIDGKPAYFDIKDPMLLESIMSIGYMGPKSKFLDVAKDFKNMLQFGVTLSPGFKVRNLFRDSFAAMATSNLKLDPFGNVVKGWADSDKNNPAHISALAGGAIFNFGSMYEGDQAKMVKRLIDKGVDANTILDTPEKVKKALIYFWDKYQDWGNKSEAANRMALYTQLKEKGYSHLEASFYARDLLDFSMQGSWPAFRFLTNVVPFLNARVQGLYKLGRDGLIPTSRVIYNTATGKPIELTDKQKAQQFSIVMVATAMASLALYMAFKDDDEFKKREQWDRDNFWWIKIPGMDDALRLPKPFELGAFGTMAERVAEQIFDQGAEGKVFKDSLGRMFMDTFALNPMPQMFKPLVDLYANKDSFTGAPIETAGMERLSKAERIAEKTSPLAIALSKVANVFLPESAELSPVQADYSIKGYFGWLGGTSSWLSHYAVMPFSKSAYPDNNWTETLSAGFIKSLPATQSKYVTAFYENNKEISQAYADMRHFAQLGQADKVQEILKEKGDKIAMAKFYDNASKDMAKMRQAIQAIRNDENMTGAQKKEEIDRMKVLIGEIARQMEEARIEVKKSYAASQ